LFELSGLAVRAAAPIGFLLVHDIFCSFESSSKGDGSVPLLTGVDHKLVLHYRPFGIEMYAGKDDLVVSLKSTINENRTLQTSFVLCQYSER
jgi:hypothetical protein